MADRERDVELSIGLSDAATARDRQSCGSAKDWPYE
jgi:hypothetical protein